MTKFLLLFLLLSIFGYKQLPLKQEATIKSSLTNDEWKTFKKSNYSIQYPSTWKLDNSGLMGSSFILFSSLESEQDKFSENVNLLIQDLRGQNMDLNQYAKTSEAQVKTFITNSKIIESKRIKQGKVEFHKIIYTGDQGEFSFEYEQYYFFSHDKAYILTFTSEQTKYDDFKEVGEKILNSFKLKR